MNDLLNDMEADFEANVASNIEKMDQGELGSVASIARQIRDKESTVSDLEATLKREKKALLKLTDEDLPTVFAEMGLSELTLDDGSKIKINPTYGGSIPVDQRPAAYEWLREHGFDDIIKNTVSCEFGRGEDDQANAFRAVAESEGYIAEQKTGVHPQTLRAFVRERVENGDSFPMEMFGAWVGHRATITRSK